ncbi:MAG: OmpA family protein [Verrucomicrobiota bacterium]
MNQSKPAIHLRFRFFTLLAILVACAVTITSCGSKKYVEGDPYGSNNEGAIASGGFEEIYDNPLPSRAQSANPATVDYQTLSNYTVLFDFDSFIIKSDQRGKLEKVAEYLNNNSSAKVMIAGHTDSRGTTQYNLGLGERRSLATRDYLIGLGVDSSRLATISYGEERPADPAENEKAWGSNRRAAIGLAR